MSRRLRRDIIYIWATRLVPGRRSWYLGDVFGLWATFLVSGRHFWCLGDVLCFGLEGCADMAREGRTGLMDRSPSAPQVCILRFFALSPAGRREVCRDGQGGSDADQ